MYEYAGLDNLEIMVEAVNYKSFLLSLIRNHLRPGMRILDKGAGIGIFAKSLRNEGHNVFCFEPDDKQAKFIEANGLPVARTLDEMETHSFDFIYSLNVLEHIDDDLDALSCWFGLLKPGGRILVYVPAFQLLYSSMDRKVGHFRRYKKNELIAKAKMAGFQIVYAKYVDSIGFLASIAYKLTNDGSGDLNRRALVIYDRLFFPVSAFVDFITHPVVGKNVYLIAERTS